MSHHLVHSCQGAANTERRPGEAQQSTVRLLQRWGFGCAPPAACVQPYNSNQSPYSPK